MAPVECQNNCGRRAAMKRPKTEEALCRECFFSAFEDEVHQTIMKGELFKRGDYVAIGASGGKDSTVLAYVLKLLNQRHNYGLNFVLLSIDEGITGYRDDSLETVKRNEIEYEMPLKILSYKELYGWTMDEIVREIGTKNNCTFCGVFRRQALDRGAMLLGVNKIVTGHNADDVAETILMNLLRGDVARLQRCTAIITGAEGSLPRCKPFKYTYEKEIVMYAYYKKLDYFSTECIYSPMAYRGHVRTLIKDLERISPSSIASIIYSGESLSIREGVKMPVQGVCSRCNYISSQEICKACVMLEGLNKGLPKLGIGKSSKVKERMAALQEPKDGDSICANNTTGKKCCGGRGNGGGCESEDQKEDSSSPCALPERRKGRRSSKKIKIVRGKREIVVEKEEEGLDDFFGCGGFSTFGALEEMELEDDEVGTIRAKMSQSQQEMDIENLGQLASTMLHLGVGGGGRGRTSVTNNS